jgi:flavin-dependent dehydrogenase
MIENFQNPKSQLNKYVLSKPFFDGSKIKKTGGGIVSTRKPIGCLVGNGIMFVGDSAFQPNPIHGGGIGPSFMAGRLAAEEGCKAIEKGDVTKEELWSYSRKFMYDYGAKSAALDVFRLFLQKCTDEDLNYGMKHRLIKEEDILKASMGEDLKLNVTEKTMRAFRGLRKLGFLRALDRTSKIMKNVKSLYKQYTPPEEYSSWIKKMEDNFQEIHDLNF